MWQAPQMTSVLMPADLYHAGVVVPDLDAAIDRLSHGRWVSLDQDR